MDDLEQGELVSPDFSGLESSLNDLIETMGKELENREKEKMEQIEKEQQQIEVDLKDEENLLETETLKEEYQAAVLSNQETQTVDLNLILTEMQTLNATTIELRDLEIQQNDLITEATITLVLTIIIVAAVKVFVSEITKW